jgi:hypothetical protein
VKNLILRTAVTFAGLGYLIAMGLYFAPEGWHFPSGLILAICPPAFLTRISMTDPSFTSVAVILAPLHALLYGILGLSIGLLLRGIAPQ